MLWLMNLGFAGGGAATPAPTPAPGGGGGRFFTPWEPKKRKFTKKDEKELKKLLLQVVEEEQDPEAELALQRKATELAQVAGALSGIKQAVTEAEKAVLAQARAHEITRVEAKRRIEEIEEEEDLILLLAGIF